MSAIVFKKNGKILVASVANGIDADQEARKIVPSGAAYKICELSELPTGSPQELWLVNDNDLDSGVGEGEL